MLPRLSGVFVPLSFLSLRGAPMRRCLNTVDEFKIGKRTTTANHIAAMRRAIEAAGIRLLFDNDGTAAGILRQDANPDLSGEAPA
jgi:hypothetical protein